MDKEFSKRRRMEKVISWFLVFVLAVTILPPSIMQRVHADDLPTYDSLFSYDGRDFIYEGERLVLTAINPKVKWSCSDNEQQYCQWKTSGSQDTGTEFILTGLHGSEEGSEVTVRAELESYGYKEITIKVKENQIFYFMKKGQRVQSSSIDLTVNGELTLTTNQNQAMAFQNDSGHISYTGSPEEGYVISNKPSRNETTTDPKSPVLITSSYKQVAEDGKEHTIILQLELHVIDSLTLNNSDSVVMEKGTDQKVSTRQIQAIPTNSANKISWSVYKGKLTADEALNSVDAEVKQYFTIADSSSGKYGNVNDVATISITKDLVLSKEKKDRIYTILARQEVNTDRYMNAVCYVEVEQPVTELKLSQTKKTLFLLGSGESTSGKLSPTTSVTAELTGDRENGVEPDHKEVTWSCSDTTVAKISVENSTACVITAQNPGHCVIVATSKDNPHASDVLYIEVAPKVSKVEITNTDMTVNLAEKQVQLFANVTSNAVSEQEGSEDYERFLNALNTTVYWSSNRPDVAEVDMHTGKVTLKSAGKVTITCTSADDQYVSDSIVLTVNVPVSSVALYYNYKKISVGESFTLDYTLLSDYPDYEPSNKEVTWETSDSKVASVDNDGKVTGVSGGTATILVRADDGQVTATCTVEVYQAVSRIDISDKTMDLNLGEEAVLEASVYPPTASEQKVIWSSNKPDIVSVSQDGVLTANKVGDPVVITAYIVDKNATIKTTCIVNVIVPVTSLSVSPASRILEKGESVLLTKKITPENATNATVIYASTDTGVATVDEKGNVTAVAGGSCYITVRTKSRDIMTSVYIKVDEKVRSLQLNKKKKTLKKGEKYALKAIIRNSSATNKGLTYTSSNPKVVAVSQKGVITAKKYGTARITCQTTDGSGKKAVCKVTVQRYVTAISLNHKTLTMKKGKSTTLRYTVKPVLADNRKVTWTSSNPLVAKVKNGKVTAVAKGSCYITCKAKDGSNVKKKCRIVVKDKVTNDDITGKRN